MQRAPNDKEQLELDDVLRDLEMQTTEFGKRLVVFEYGSRKIARYAGAIYLMACGLVLLAGFAARMLRV